MNEPKFCFICGEKLVMRYQCNDPESGPAEMRCRNDAHPNTSDEVEDRVLADPEFFISLIEENRLISEQFDKIQPMFEKLFEDDRAENDGFEHHELHDLYEQGKEQ